MAEQAFVRTALREACSLRSFSLETKKDEKATQSQQAK